MAPFKKTYVPSFNSPLSSSQRDAPQPDQPLDRTKPHSRYRPDPRADSRAHVDVRGRNKRLLLKVKLLQHDRTLSKKVNKTPRRGTGEPGNETETTVNRTGAAESESVGDVFFFSQRPSSTAATKKEKAKLSVLKTIFKMTEENKITRQRLAVLSQTSEASHTGLLSSSPPPLLLSSPPPPLLLLMEAPPSAWSNPSEERSAASVCQQAAAAVSRAADTGPIICAGAAHLRQNPLKSRILIDHQVIPGVPHSAAMAATVERPHRTQRALYSARLLLEMMEEPDRCY
ncbi:hypothetical protein EYF80_014004 [Liparis tanakae]|uniref:Uncharacterized protein n=1 Tax=Liparis tanakae TaxID=230148 RepID=A0A4Z2ID35_9TELE|nr:hypothetical protein EYF80_014004 [Liparis tanakae]